MPTTSTTAKSTTRDQKRHAFVPSTPEQRAKFWTLIALAGVVIVMFWLLVLPFHLRSARDETLDGSNVISVIGKPFSKAAETIPIFFESFSNKLD